jgi:hypothetical protein
MNLETLISLPYKFNTVLKEKDLLVDTLPR